MGPVIEKQKSHKLIGFQKSMFNFHKIVGRGGFGRVWKVSEKKTKLVYAMKVIDKARVITKRSVSSIMNERQLLVQIQQHNNYHIVNMKCAFQDRQNLYLLMDYLEAGDLRYYINNGCKFKQDQIKFIVTCIMKGLDFLHQHNIIHRDIKPQNIIFDKNGYCRITDMGIARHWKMQNSTETSGTPGYMAPEVLLKQNHSFCVDYYAMGIIAYELFVGKRPYNGRDRHKIRDQMLAKQARISPRTQGASKQFIDFVNKILQRTTRKRLGYNGVSQIWSHPWMNYSKQYSKQFDKRLVISPIKTLQLKIPPNMQQLTEPDQVWRQNILLLKKPETQKMFSQYQFYPEEKKIPVIPNIRQNTTDLTMPTRNYITTKE